MGGFMLKVFFFLFFFFNIAMLPASNVSIEADNGQTPHVKKRKHSEKPTTSNTVSGNVTNPLNGFEGEKQRRVNFCYSNKI